MAILTRGLLHTTALTNVGLVASGLALASGSAMALPQSGQVVGGQATIVQSSPSQLTINQSSSNAVINWQSFSIGKTETTTFNQPNSGSIAFNRVTGVDPSVIQGSLKANGEVILVNPNGMLFTNTSKVDVGSLIASTAGFTNANAMAGKAVFDQAGSSTASIKNAGTITAEQGGLVALVAPNVANSGVITAKLGKVALAAGDKWTLDLYGDKLVQFAVNDQTSGKINQSGIINANTDATGGYAVQLTVNDAKSVVSNVINMSGLINATSVSTDGGAILLEANTAGADVTGQMNSNGGKIVVSGADVTLKGATINSTGTAGGGTVDIGTGDGVLATNVTADANTSIVANGTGAGNGGTVNVMSSEATKYAGKISAKGGSKGNGGVVLTDGNTLNVDGASVDTSAANSNNGYWTLDQTSMVVNAGMAKAVDSALALGSVIIESGEATNSSQGNIQVNSALSYNSENELTLSAYDSIDVNAAIKNAGDGGIILRADNTGTDVGSVTFGKSGSAIGGGHVSIYYDPTAGYSHPVVYTSAQAHGAEATTAYMLVNNANDLDAVRTNLGGTYALGKDISNVGIAPIGDATTPFTGLFDGFGGIGLYSINETNIFGTSYVGLFGDNAGTIRNLSLTDVYVVGNEYTGGLVGYNSGKLINDSVSGSVFTYDTTLANSISTGGLVGYNSQTGIINNGKVTGLVSIDSYSYDAGGFVGTNLGTILDSSFTGTVDAGCNEVGGFVGANYGLISAAKAAAKIINGGGGQIGGFAGLNGSKVIGGHTYTGALYSDSASGGSVYTGDYDTQVGGFVGVNEGGALISGSTATGAFYVGNITTAAGGFAGANLGNSTIENSTSNVLLTIGSNDNDIGGFVGQNGGTLVGDRDNTGAMTFGSNDTDVGGFAGYNSGGIYGVLTLAPLTGVDNDTNIGGLVGYNIGNVNNSGATGNVTLGNNSQNVGGFAGYNGGALILDTVGGAYTGQATITGSACDCTATPAAQSPASAVEVGMYSTNIGGYVGYDASGTLQSVTVANSVRAGLGSQNVGGLVGQNHATLLNDTVKANVYSAQYSGSVGGMVGLNYGRINNAGVTGAILVGGSTDFGGGVIGANYGYVTNSDFSQGSVVAGCDQIGGFVGGNFGTIASSNFTGLVENGGGYQTGGFAGQNNAVLADDTVINGTVDLCSVTQGGGFVGYNSHTGTITDASATVTLTNSADVTDQGGFAGKNDGTITGSKTDADVTIGSGSGYIGGFAGTNSGTLSDDSAAGTVNAGASSVAIGGFVGGNFGQIGGSSTTANVHTVDFETYVGGYAGLNAGTITNGNATSNVTVGSNATAVGGLVGYNTGLFSGGSAVGSITTGDNTFYVGGDIGWNDAGGTVAGVSHNGTIKVGNNVSGVGGVAGLNGSDQTDGHGNFASAAAEILSGTSKGNISVGTNSFAVAGLVGWNSAWLGGNTSTGGVYYGEVADGHDGILSGDNVTSQGTVTGQTGTTYIHNANQNGCDERMGGNCFGTAGQEIITVNANGGSSVYGDPTAVDLAYTLTGQAPGNSSSITKPDVLESYDVYTDVVTGSLADNVGTNAGTYQITQGTVGLNQGNANALLDYKLVFNGATYTIQKAELDITANGVQTYGDTTPSVSYSYTGLKNGDASSIVTGVSYSTAVNNFTDVGSYGITAVGGTATNNYFIVDKTGTLIVNPAPLVITVVDTSKQQGDPNPVFTATYGGLVNNDPTSVVTGLAFNTPATTTSGVGVYDVDASGAMSKNYKITYVQGTLTVLAQPSQQGNPTPLVAPVTPIVASSQGSLVPLIPTSVIGSLNQAAQIDCLKVNLEIRGVQTDSPIDCSQPLQVNGF